MIRMFLKYIKLICWQVGLCIEYSTTRNDLNIASGNMFCFFSAAFFTYFSVNLDLCVFVHFTLFIEERDYSL